MFPVCTPKMLFADRVRDLKFVRDHLDTILNGQPGWNGCFNVNQSRVALGGHSFGAITTLQAAGVKVAVDGQAIDLEDYNLSRVAGEYSPFVQAEAYLGINGANHVTSVSNFMLFPFFLDFPSWVLGFLWEESIEPHLEGEEFDQLVHAVLENMGANFEQFIADGFDTIFLDREMTQLQEEARLQAFQTYTLAFWDAFLSTRYNPSGARWWLDQPESWHIWEGPQVENDEGFKHNRASTALIVRDRYGIPMAQFQSDGNVLLHTDYFAEWAWPIETDPDIEEFCIRNAGGTVVAKIDPDDGLTLTGSVSDNWASGPISSPDFAEFIIRSATDPAGYARIVIDAQGNLKTRGGFYTPSSLP